jgi:hypothetical protein
MFRIGSGRLTCLRWCSRRAGCLDEARDHGRDRRSHPGAVYRVPPETPHMQTPEMPELVAEVLNDFLRPSNRESRQAAAFSSL